MKQLISVFFILFLWRNVSFVASELDYYVFPERVETIKGESESIINFDQFKFIRRRIGDFYASGNFSYLKDMGKDYIVGLDTAYSPKGNNQFIKHPFRLPTANVCEYFNKTYVKYLEPMFIGKTNFPKIPPEGLCPIPKGDYYVKNLLIDNSLLPSYVPRGLWRLEEKFYKNNKLVGGVRIYAKAVDK